MAKFGKIGLIVAILFLIAGNVHAQEPGTSLEMDRVIRATDYLNDDEIDLEEVEKPRIQITGIFLGRQEIFLNKQFKADKNWLSNLRIRIKNISESTITCLRVSFGLLAQLDTKLKTHESWPWSLDFGRGDCQAKGPFATRGRLLLRPNDEVFLDHRDIPKGYRQHHDRTGELAKAVLHPNAFVGFVNGKPIEVPIILPYDTYFLNDEPY